MSLNLITVYYLPSTTYTNQKMYHKACNITEFVLKLEQKLLIESCLKRKILVQKCFCPLTHLVSNLVIFALTYYILYFRVLGLTTLFFVLS